MIQSENFTYFTQINKVSILNDTIKYLKMLEARVQELETCMDSLYYEERFRRKYLDMVEQTSDNYDYDKIEGTLKPSTNKRKACEMDETDLKLKNNIPKDGLKLDVKVTMNEQEVLVDMHCPYREYILVDVMDTLNDLQLDAHSVQSSDRNGVFSLTLKSKVCNLVSVICFSCIDTTENPTFEPSTSLVANHGEMSMSRRAYIFHRLNHIFALRSTSLIIVCKFIEPSTRNGNADILSLMNGIMTILRLFDVLVAISILVIELCCFRLE